MFVWSKKLVGALLRIFLLLLGVFLLQGPSDNTSVLKTHTTQWIILNYACLLVWLFVWMIDQGRVRGKNVWLWLVPFIVAPLPTLMIFVLFLQRRLSS